MPRLTPPFPAFDMWQKMSESEQDALIARMERARAAAAMDYLDFWPRSC
jgi:hypothetical protein